MRLLPMDKEGSRLLLEKTEAIVYCNMGQGTETCCFLAVGPDGLECLFKNKKNKKQIEKMYNENKMVSRWLGCKWNWVDRKKKEEL